MEKHVVTGAFGYSGKHIARRLLSEGREVATLTGSAQREHPFGDRVKAFPFDFEHPENMVPVLAGAKVFYNTYWVRFNHEGFDHATAVKNTLKLFWAAKEAGVGRIVHVSITNPSKDSPFEYFRGKAELEEALAELGTPHTILRPAVLFGPDDILVNNIAWVLRRFPVFGVFGDGSYRLQPIHVDDFAAAAVLEGKAQGSRVVDAIGPETYTYRELVKTVASKLGLRRIVAPMPPALLYAVSKAVGAALGDVLVTWEEIGGLMADLLHVSSPPLGSTRLSRWLEENSKDVGLKYAYEVKRRVDRRSSYEKL